MRHQGLGVLQFVTRCVDVKEAGAGPLSADTRPVIARMNQGRARSGFFRRGKNSFE